MMHSWADPIERHTFVEKAIVLKEIDSTNSYAKQLVRSQAPQLPVVIVALSQTCGRGRSGKTWWAGHGSLCLTLIFPGLAQSGRTAIASGLAVCKTVKHFFGQLQPILKWPNDVMLSDKKLSGILIENVVTAESVATLIGIGVFGSMYAVVQLTMGHTPWALLAYERRPEVRPRRHGPGDGIYEYDDPAAEREAGLAAERVAAAPDTPGALKLFARDVAALQAETRLGQDAVAGMLGIAPDQLDAMLGGRTPITERARFGLRQQLEKLGLAEAQEESAMSEARTHRIQEALEPSVRELVQAELGRKQEKLDKGD